MDSFYKAFKKFAKVLEENEFDDGFLQRPSRAAVPGRSYFRPLYSIHHFHLHHISPDLPVPHERKDWAVGSHNYLRFDTSTIATKLEDLMSKLLNEVLSRSVEVKVLHGSLVGQKRRTQILKTIYKRAPRVENLIARFSEVARNLLGDRRIPLLKLEAFQPPLGDDEIEGDISPLIQCQALQILLITHGKHLARVVIVCSINGGTDFMCTL
ncbi:hypothetical protein K440DRAFT_667047 [Wilcoxina mikolae CBS 423.85]|nr:hypothetical protein K440DRAFT_667047 [Wilcoxina mikolae CBS 423.85]